MRKYKNNLEKLEATKKVNLDQNDETSASTEVESPLTPEGGTFTQADKQAVALQKDTIQYDDFTKLDMRVGTIVEAEKMPKADRLLKLKVDTGLDVRTIVSGLAEHFTTEEIIGKKVTVLVNLAPRKLRGTESEGMILMTEDVDGKLVFLSPESSENKVSNGKKIS